MEWGNKLEWLQRTNKTRVLTILFKNNLNYDLLKTYQDPHGRFLFLENKIKNSFCDHSKYLWSECRRFCFFKLVRYT